MWIYKYLSRRHLRLVNPERGLEVHIEQLDAGHNYRIRVSLNEEFEEMATVGGLSTAAEWKTPAMGNEIAWRLEQYIKMRERHCRAFQLFDLVDIVGGYPVDESEEEEE